MFEFIAISCIIAAVALLIILSIIDLKILILPDELNFCLGLSGLIFHFATQNIFASYIDMTIGAVIGAGFLYVIRFFSNRHYGRDTLGLGDVKLMGAAGIWLGTDGILLAITAGALAGLIHGLIYAASLSMKNKTPFSVHHLAIPAGPGFAIGIVMVGAWLFGPYIAGVAHGFLA